MCFSIWPFSWHLVRWLSLVRLFPLVWTPGCCFRSHRSDTTVHIYDLVHDFFQWRQITPYRAFELTELTCRTELLTTQEVFCHISFLYLAIQRALTHTKINWKFTLGPEFACFSLKVLPWRWHDNAKRYMKCALALFAQYGELGSDR